MVRVPTPNPVVVYGRREATQPPVPRFNLSGLAGARPGPGRGGLAAADRPVRAPGLPLVSPATPAARGHRRRVSGGFPGRRDPHPDLSERACGGDLPRL